MKHGYICGPGILNPAHTMEIEAGQGVAVDRAPHDPAARAAVSPQTEPGTMRGELGEISSDSPTAIPRWLTDHYLRWIKYLVSVARSYANGEIPYRVFASMFSSRRLKNRLYYGGIITDPDGATIVVLTKGYELSYIGRRYLQRYRQSRGWGKKGGRNA